MFLLIRPQHYSYKNFSKIYDESGKVVGIKEIIEKEDD